MAHGGGQDEGSCASALEERRHLGHLEIRHYCMFGRFGFKASFAKIKKSINLQVR